MLSLRYLAVTGHYNARWASISSTRLAAISIYMPRPSSTSEAIVPAGPYMHELSEPHISDTGLLRHNYFGAACRPPESWPRAITHDGAKARCWHKILRFFFFVHLIYPTISCGHGRLLGYYYDEPRRLDAYAHTATAPRSRYRRFAAPRHGAPNARATARHIL